MRLPVISVMLAAPDARAAIDWYSRALGAAQLWSFGSVAGLEIAGAPFFVGPPEEKGWESPVTLGTTSVRVEVFCDDPDGLIARALEGGARGSLENIKNHAMPWGPHRQGGSSIPSGTFGLREIVLR